MKKIHELMNEVSTGAITHEEYMNEYRQIHHAAMRGDMDTVNDLIAFRKESAERSKEKQDWRGYVFDLEQEAEIAETGAIFSKDPSYLETAVACYTEAADYFWNDSQYEEAAKRYPAAMGAVEKYGQKYSEGKYAQKDFLSDFYARCAFASLYAAQALAEQRSQSLTYQNMERLMEKLVERLKMSKAAFEKINVKPDIIIGCAGGGSNLGGLIGPFMGEKLRGEADYRIIAVEPASCPSLTRGKFAYDFCDTGKITPLAKMYTLGSGFIPSANHAGGLRYHGMSPVLSQLYHDGYIEAVSVEQTAVFEAAELFARCEGLLPAPESSHAIRAAIDEAMKCKETGEEKTIVFGLTGTGYFDLVAYQQFNDGVMNDYIPTDEELAKYAETLPPQPEE